MKTRTAYITPETKKRIDFVNITSRVEDEVGKSGVKEGIVLINPMHITASVYVNDAESGLLHDFEKWLEKLAPKDVGLYKHNLTGEDNAYSHLWRTVMGRETVVAVTNGRLDFGTWEQVYYAEFDGQRKKRVLVKIIGE